MVILSVESEKLSILLDKLFGVVDFNKDLPMNVFTSDEFAFWFFERPLICFSEIFAGLIFESFLRFDSAVFVKILWS